MSQNHVLGQKREDLARCLAAEEGGDERLPDGERAVVRERVAPALEVVRERHVPGARLGGLVGVAGHRDTGLRLGVGRGKIEIWRRGVEWVFAEDDQGVDLPAVQIGGERRELRLHARFVHLFGVGDGAADVTEHGVDARCQGVDLGRLVGARDHQGAALVGDQILGERFEELGHLRLAQERSVGLGLGGTCVGGAGGGAHGGVEGCGEGLDQLGPNREPMIGDAARVGKGRLDHVEAVHPGRVGITPRCHFPRVA